MSAKAQSAERTLETPANEAKIGSDPVYLLFICDRAYLEDSQRPRSVVQRFGCDVDVAGPYDCAVIDGRSCEKGRPLQLDEWFLVHVRRHVEEALLAIFERK